MVKIFGGLFFLFLFVLCRSAQEESFRSKVGNVRGRLSSIGYPGRVESRGLRELRDLTRKTRLISRSLGRVLQRLEGQSQK